MEDRPNEEELAKYLDHVQDWRTLGSALNISNQKLSEINKSFSETRDRRQTVLSLWLKENFMNATRNAIIEALHDIGEHTVANEYTKYVAELPVKSGGLYVGPQPLRGKQLDNNSETFNTQSMLLNSRRRRG